VDRAEEPVAAPTAASGLDHAACLRRRPGSAARLHVVTEVEQERALVDVDDHTAGAAERAGSYPREGYVEDDAGGRGRPES